MIKLELTKEDLQIIEMALMEIPTKFGAPLIIKIRDQVTAEEKQDGE